MFTATVSERMPDGNDGPMMVTGTGKTVYNAIRKLLKNHEHVGYVLPAQSCVRLSICDGEDEVFVVLCVTMQQWPLQKLSPVGDKPRGRP